MELIFVNHATAQVQTTISAKIGLDKKKFSIIIPIQNNGKYLSKCIDRIMNQSYRDLEIILVNSGSDKNVNEICRKYEKSDDRIKYRKQTEEWIKTVTEYAF